MKHQRFSIFLACSVFGFSLAVPGSLYAEEGVSETPATEKPTAPETVPAETEPSTTEETSTPTSEPTPVDVVSETPTVEETTAPETETTETTEETTAPIVEEVAPEETPAPEETTTVEPELITEAIPETSVTTFILHIRLEGKLLYEGETSIPQSDLQIPDSTGLNHTVAADSLLAALYSVDQTEDSFAITDLTYYESFGAFFLNCIKAAANAEASCGNWVFVVNDTSPYSSIDQYTVQTNDEVYIFFGSQYRALADQETVELGQSISGQAQTYNYKTNVWEGTNSVTLSVIQDNPENPWSPIVVTSSAVSNTGSATFTLSATGSYKFGIDEEYFMHTALFAVIDAIATSSLPLSTPSSTPRSTPETSNNSNSNSNSCSDCSTVELVAQSTIDESIEKILAYVRSQQKSNGMIIDGATTDWLIMSFGATGVYADTVAATTSSLLDYAKNYSFSSGAELNLCAGYPRHVLALLGAGVDATDTSVTELLQKIKGSECFDGTTYGEAGINDDIFALISLFATNESTGSAEISALVSSITADQKTSGAFTWNGWEGADVTGAAINALKYAVQKGIAVEADIFSQAKEYLKQEQLNDGGWGYGSSDVLTTSWAMMGIHALGEGQSDWASPSGKNPWHILTESLNAQGYYTSPYSGSKPDWFATKHAVPALKGSTWPIILTPIVEETPNTCSSVCNSRNEQTTTRQTTSTEQTATTTPHSLLEVPNNIPPQFLDNQGTIPEVPSDIIEVTLPTEDETPITVINEILEETITTPSLALPRPLARPVARALVNPSEVLAEAALGPEPEDETEKDAPATIEPTTEIIEDPLAKKIAEKVFNSAAVGTASVGLFLAWRFLRTLL